MQVQKTAHMIGYCYNKYECWPSAIVSGMRACRFKFNRHDCWLGATLKDIANDWIHFLHTWLMARCECNLHGCREDEIETDIHADSKKKYKAGQVQL